MRSDELARLLASRIARRQSRGLVDDASGMTDVVVHGRVDLLAVAADLIAASALQPEAGRRSWAGWFAGDVEHRREARRRERGRARLAERIERGESEAEVALARLRLRELDEPS